MQSGPVGDLLGEVLKVGAMPLDFVGVASVWRKFVGDGAIGGRYYLQETRFLPVQGEAVVAVDGPPLNEKTRLDCCVGFGLLGLRMAKAVRVVSEALEIKAW